MSIQDQIISDRDAVTAAQAALDAAVNKLAADQSALEAVQPHLSALEKIEAFSVNIPEQARELFQAAIAEAKGLF